MSKQSYVQTNISTFVRVETLHQSEATQKKLQEYQRLISLPHTNTQESPTFLMTNRYLRVVDKKQYLLNKDDGFWMLFFPYSWIDHNWQLVKDSYLSEKFEGVSTICCVHSGPEKDACIQLATAGPEKQSEIKKAIQSILRILDHYSHHYVYYKSRITTHSSQKRSNVEHNSENSARKSLRATNESSQNINNIGVADGISVLSSSSSSSSASSNSSSPLISITPLSTSSATPAMLESNGSNTLGMSTYNSGNTRRYTYRSIVETVKNCKTFTLYSNDYY